MNGPYQASIDSLVNQKDSGKMVGSKRCGTDDVLYSDLKA
jgi:hypothetical protein